MVEFMRQCPSAFACSPCPATRRSLAANPFRGFTSLLRLELIRDPALCEPAAQILERRSIFSARAVALTARFEATGELTSDEANEFVREVLDTFRWHGEATVSQDTYMRLHEAHRLIGSSRLSVKFPSLRRHHRRPYP
jgi:uncharacterized glyoxalase superfamily metalloenzyme YdcJ